MKNFSPKVVDEFCRSLAAISSTAPCNKELVLDAVEDLEKSLYDNKSELNEIQIARQDEIEKSIMNTIRIITCNSDLEWNMELIGDVAESICRILSRKGHLIYYPVNKISKDEEKLIISNFHNDR